MPGRGFSVGVSFGRGVGYAPRANYAPAAAYYPAATYYVPPAYYAAPAPAPAHDPMILASDGRWYPRSAWGQPAAPAAPPVQQVLPPQLPTGATAPRPTGVLLPAYVVETRTIVVQP